MKRLARKTRATSQAIPVLDGSPSREVIAAQVSHHGFRRPQPRVHGGELVFNPFLSCSVRSCSLHSCSIMFESIVFNRIGLHRVRFNHVLPSTRPSCELHELHQGVAILYKDFL